MDSDCVCLFCTGVDINLYEINNNSIIIGSDLVDFNEIIFELFHGKVSEINFLLTQTDSTFITGERGRHQLHLRRLQRLVNAILHLQAERQAKFVPVARFRATERLHEPDAGWRRADNKNREEPVRCVIRCGSTARTCGGGNVDRGAVSREGRRMLQSRQDGNRRRGSVLRG